MQDSSITESESDFQQAKNRVEEAKTQLQAGRFTDAQKTVETVLEQHPEYAEALYVLAVTQRYQKQFDAALNSLERLKKARPGYGRAFQEEGHIHLATSNQTAALDAFGHAVTLNSSLFASWDALSQLLSSNGQHEQARFAKDQHTKLAALPPALLNVRNMMAEGRMFQAEQVCRQFMQANPRNVEGMRLLADLGVKSGVLDDAEVLLENAIKFEPNNNLARHEFMHVLYRRQKYAQALKQATILRDKEPDNLDYRISFANQCVAVGDYEPALEIYKHAITKVPNRADLHLVHGHALKTIGQTDDAITAYRRAYNARPEFGDAYWSLANLKTYRFTREEISAMQTAEAATSTPVVDKIHLCFALGKHFEDASDFETSMQYYENGNALEKNENNYESEKMSERLQMQIEHCGTALFNNKKDLGHPAPDPIFIVGLPRAGSTLLEQILASHSQIDGTLELPNISSLAFDLAGRRHTYEELKYPANLTDLTAEQLQKYGQAFIKDTRVHREDAPFFIDKMPNNFRHIALIHLILPNAKIIDARRHPMACCFSGFKQLFANGQEFTYGQSEIGTYYRDYVELMDHWDAVLPGKILRVQYEEVVADTESQVHRILEYLGLPFEEACLNFHKTKRSVRTASSEQVRQPIYTSGLEQWRNFEPWLEPLKSSLGAVLERYPIDDPTT